MLRLKKKSISAIIEIVQDYMREGKTLEQFITDFNLSYRQWMKFYNKYKRIRNAVSDGVIYHRAFMQRQMNTDIRKGKHSPLAKMAYEQSFGWSEIALKNKKAEKPKKMYKVYLDLREEEGNEDKFTEEAKSGRNKHENKV